MRIKIMCINVNRFVTDASLDLSLPFNLKHGDDNNIDHHVYSLLKKTKTKTIDEVWTGLFHCEHSPSFPSIE